ncbi:NIPSNAP family protein [Acetobacter sp. TBRC 12305]|uniref:NIPSNAP family protein n=1 Tax=Acetobacter garciniae TaxID=2817435 RepID=A0A939KPR4_9PROT|nr:NIPSNAP family protein [Acetobacter garciniae]MBO1324267.1 NIPSNAP family protein [Acetobacter garciniae]MBX0343956.1 NIPSNAP family protein [Acetobacter garciniae]
MIYEIRTYQLKTGAVPAYVKVVSEEGILIQKPHLGTLAGYFFSEIGPLNQIVHIWAYQDLADRDARRAALAADPRWVAFLPKIQCLIETMENKIMKPLPFFDAAPA